MSRHIAAGIRSAGGAAVELPVADGGEGTFDVLVRGLGARRVGARTVGPWGDDLTAEIGLTADGTAVVELAAASGLNLPSGGERDPVTASTSGTGVLIAEAARLGARRVLVACGGSATTDGGAGAIAAIEERGGAPRRGSGGPQRRHHAVRRRRPGVRAAEGRRSGRRRNADRPP